MDNILFGALDRLPNSSWSFQFTWT